MNYAAHYGKLIERSRARILVGYRERHHVVPRCVGGTNDRRNVVELTAEEHYVAHQLLVKMNPNSRGLAWAAVNMARRANGNKAYGWLRRRHAATLLGNKGRTGQRNSPEHRANQSKALRGRKPPPKSAETIEKHAAQLRGRVLSPEVRARMSAGRLGTRRPPFSPEWLANIAAASAGRKHTPETLKKMAERMRGNSHSLGKKLPPRSPEYRAKLLNQKAARRFTHDGITKTITGWAEHFDVTRATVNLRLRNGWTFDEVAMDLQPRTGCVGL